SRQTTGEGGLSVPSFHNPYHFVPALGGGRPDDLPVKDFKSGKVGHITHDRFVTQTDLGGTKQPVYSGRLVCRLTTEDPTVIGAQRTQANEDPAAIWDVEPFELDGEPAIPATTLRGLISS